MCGQWGTAAARWQHFMSHAKKCVPATGIASHPASTATIEIEIKRRMLRF